MINNPIISIIIPIYNVEQYLEQCLSTIAEQTFTDFEVLMIDDGSPDSSSSICMKYQLQDSRFKYFKKQNGGAASARNYGMSIAKGKFFAFIDSDDYLNDNYLTDLYNQVKATKCDIAIISYLMKNEKNKFYVPLNPNGDDLSFNKIYSPEEWIKTFFNRDGMIYTAPWGKLFNRKVLDGVFFPTRIGAGDDQFVVWRAYMNADKISFDNKQDYCYFINSGSLSHVNMKAGLYGVEALEEQISTFTAMGLDTSYMLPLYLKRLEGLYAVAMKTGDYYEAMNTKYKIDKIKNIIRI